MAYKITDECIMCDACVSFCPEKAIKSGDPNYIIDDQLCNDCAACAEICPTQACVPE